MLVFRGTILFSCRILINLDFCAKIFEKYKNINFLENLFSWTRVFPCERRERDREEDGRKHGDDKVNSPFSRICERTKKWHNFSWSMKWLAVSESFVVIWQVLRLSFREILYKWFAPRNIFDTHILLFLISNSFKEAS